MHPYERTRLECVVESLFHHLDINSIDKIDMHFIADSLGVCCTYAPIRSMAHTADKLIIIDDRSNSLTQREDFAHELAHILIHAGSHLVFPDLFVQLQESQANKLAMYLLIPHHFLLEAIESGHQSVSELADLFSVSISFMKRRLKALEQKMMSAMAAEQFAAAMDTLPKMGRDFHSIWSVGLTDYYCDSNGKILFKRQRARL